MLSITSKSYLHIMSLVTSKFPKKITNFNKIRKSLVKYGKTRAEKIILAPKGRKARGMSGK